MALFIENQIIPIHYTEKRLFWNRETKEWGTLFEIMPFTVPDALKTKQEKVKQVLEEAFTCMQVSKSDQFITYTEVEFAYNQPFIPVGNPR